MGRAQRLDLRCEHFPIHQEAMAEDKGGTVSTSIFVVEIHSIGESVGHGVTVSLEAA